MISFPEQSGGIYVHVPYCVRKCPYCDFFSSADSSSIPDFLDCLELEMAMVAGSDRIYDSLYIGGGTPSVLIPESLARIIEAAQRHFKIVPDVEITLEVNPGTVNRDSLVEYRQAGINRLNIGVQSFNDENLKFLGRIHASAEAGFSIGWARQAGFENIGLDLIYGLPGQNKKQWRDDLNRAVQADIEHLSCYVLTCESGTPLSRDVDRGRVKLPAGDFVRELFDTTIDYLNTHGFRQYEISNFAKRTDDGAPALHSRHNQKYWSFAPYIGLGPSAHSFQAPTRYWNHRSIEAYVRQIKSGHLPIADKESLTREQIIMEAIYLSLRTTRGINLDDFEKMFALDFLKTFEAKVPGLEKDRFLKVTNSHCALTPKGMACLDSIAAMLTGQEFS